MNQLATHYRSGMWKPTRGNGPGPSLRLVLLAAFGLLALPLIASIATLPAGAAPRKTERLPYRVEFRGRMGTPVGHAYLVAGKRDRNGRFVPRLHAGFFVEPDPVKLALSLIGTQGVVRASPLDARYRPLATYGVDISAAQYRRLAAHVERTRRAGRPYTLFDNNCNRFVQEAARSIGLKTPADTVVLPPAFITRLKRLNTPASRRMRSTAARTDETATLPRELFAAY